MHYRKLGRTGIEVSELVFGGGAVGGLLVFAAEETKLGALEAALAAGINWIDTAPLYGQGKSEEALGRLLPQIDATPHVSTKLRLDLGSGEDIPSQVARSLEASLGRLNRPSVDLLQLHNAIGEEPGARGRIGLDQVLGKGGVADAMDAMRDGGLTRFMGITGLGEADATIGAIESGRFDTAQVYYNMLNPSAGRAVPAGFSGHDFTGVLDACRRMDVGALCIRVFAAGVLATDIRHGREAVLTDGSEIADEEARTRTVFQRLGDAYGSRAQTAVRFGLANADLAAVIVGLAEPAHLSEALTAAEMGPLPGDAVEALKGLWETDFGRLSGAD